MSFIPGKTLVHVAGQVFGGEERLALANLAMDADRPLQLTAGRRHAELEMKLAKRFGVRHAILVNSGSSANLLAFQALCETHRIPRGSKILTVACAFPTTVAPIIQAGMVPVFVDVGPDGNVDVEALAGALNGLRAPEGEPIRAVVLAHALGFPFNLDAVRGLCEHHGIPLLADSCDAAGATWRGEQVTFLADVSTMSMYPAHHMTTGEGGCVLTDREDIATVARSFRDWGRDCHCLPDHDNTCGARFEQPQEVLGSLPQGYDHKYVYSRLGYNLKMTEMQAAVGLVQLAKLDGFIERRRDTWGFYAESLAGLGLTSPHADAYFNATGRPGDPSPFGFLMLSPERARLVQALEAHRIQTRPLFAGNLLRHPCMKGVEFQVPVEHRAVGQVTFHGPGPDLLGLEPWNYTDALPGTERMMREAFWIGVYPGVTDEMREYVVKVLREECRR